MFREIHTLHYFERLSKVSSRSLSLHHVQIRWTNEFILSSLVLPPRVH
jgi:hypothetical protein